MSISGSLIVGDTPDKVPDSGTVSDHDYCAAQKPGEILTFMASLPKKMTDTIRVEILFRLKTPVEIIFDRPLVAPGDDQDIGDSDLFLTAFAGVVSRGNYFLRCCR